MAIDLASLPSWAIGGLAAVKMFTGTLTRAPVAGIVEQWGRARAMVKIVREQRRMAALAVGRDVELRHSVAGGPELVIRSSASPKALKGK